MTTETMIEAPRRLWSDEAEQSVLGALMIDPAAFDAVSATITASSFGRAEHRSIYAAIQRLRLDGKTCDAITVLHALTDAGQECGGRAYLDALCDSIPSARNASRHAELIAEKAAQRAVMAAADEAADVAKGSGTVAAKLDRIGALFGALERAQVTTAPRSIVDIATARTAHYEALQDGTAKPGWPTHIPALDRLLNGGFAPGRLYILAARPSVGKSSFAQYLGLQLAGAGLPTLFLSQEMSADELADRGVANLGRIAYSSLLSGKMDKDHWSRATDALDEMGRRAFFVDDKPALRLVEIRSKARSIKGLKVLVLDYLQLCSSDLPAKENRNAQVEEISRGLKSLSKELGIAVIALSQLNRSVETRGSKRPMLSDLRDSGAIEQDADCVMFLWPVQDMKERKLIGCAIEKNRSGRCGSFGLDFDGEYQRWGESTMSIEHQAPAPSGKGRAFE